MTITFAIPTPPTSSATAPSPRKSDVKVLFAAARASIASDGRRDVDLVRRLRDRSCVRAPRARPRRPRGRPARRATSTSRPRRPRKRAAAANPTSAALSSDGTSVDRVEDPHDGEPRAADDDLDPAAGPVDPEPAGSRRSQDHGGVAGRRVVEEDAAGECGAERAEQRRVGGERRDALRLARPASAPTGTRRRRPTRSPRPRRPARSGRSSPVASRAAPRPRRRSSARARRSAGSSPAGRATRGGRPCSTPRSRGRRPSQRSRSRSRARRARPGAVARAGRRRRRAARRAAASLLGASSITRRAPCRARRGRRAARPVAAARRRAPGRG